MAWPTGMPLVTITQDVHKLPDGSLPSSYAVHLQLSVPALVFDGVTTLIRRSITLTAEAGSGVISGQVPHLNHPDLSPTPVYYMVTEFADGQRVRDPWQLTPAADDVTIDLDAAAPLAGDPGTPVAVGPPGPTAVSEDAGNIAILGSDDLLYVGEAQVGTAVEDYLTENPVEGFSGDYNDLTNRPTFKTVTNRTGTTIPADTLVEIDGAFGVFSTVRVADNTTADHVAGITVAEIADGDSGEIQVTGTVEELDTSAFTAGEPIYLGTSGAWTDTRPTDPAHIIRVGVTGVTHPTAGTVVFTLPAFEITADHVDGLDAKVTALAEDPTSELGASLSDTYATIAQITTLTLPESPTAGQSATVLADSTTTWPATITWDSGGEPTITTGRLLLTFVWSGADWVGTYGLPFAAAPDTTAPTVPADLTATATSDTTVDLSWTASTDAVGVAGYEYRIDGGTPVDAGAGTAETVTGLTAETLYSFEVRAYDAATNYSDWSPAATATTQPASGTVIAADTFNRADSTTLGTTTTGALTWSEVSGNLQIIGSQASPVFANVVTHKAIVDTGYADCTISADFTPGTPLWSGFIVFRYVDEDNFCYAELTNGGLGNILRVRYKVGGSLSALAYDTVSGSVSSGVAVNLAVVLSGSSVTLKLDGVTIRTHTLAEMLTATKHGLGFYTTDPGELGDSRFDNFEVVL